MCICLFFIVGKPLGTINISNASVDKDIVTVNWTAANRDVIEILKLNISSDDGDEEIHIIDKEEGKVITRTPLEPGEYILTLTAFDICKQSYSSKPHHLNVTQDPTSIPSSDSPPHCTPTPVVIHTTDNSTGSTSKYFIVLQWYSESCKNAGFRHFLQ